MTPTQRRPCLLHLSSLQDEVVSLSRKQPLSLESEVKKLPLLQFIVWVKVIGYLFLKLWDSFTLFLESEAELDLIQKPHNNDLSK